MFGLLKNRRRARLQATPLPASWREIMQRGAPLCRRLSAAQLRDLEGHVQVFLHEKSFEGCGGQAITDEVRVVIAANACLLLLGRETNYFPHMGSVLVYPSSFRVHQKVSDEHGLESEIDEENLGEAWERGSVILSYEDVMLDARDTTDGFNLVLHEFAHQLDMEDGSPNGSPILARHLVGRWNSVMAAEYQALCEKTDRLDDLESEVDEKADWNWELRPRPELGEDFVLDPYGAEDPAEFFAVATEAFFEDGKRLRERHRSFMSCCRPITASILQPGRNIALVSWFPKDSSSCRAL